MIGGNVTEEGKMELEHSSDRWGLSLRKEANRRNHRLPFLLLPASLHLLCRRPANKTCVLWFFTDFSDEMPANDVCPFPQLFPFVYFCWLHQWKLDLKVIWRGLSGPFASCTARPVGTSRHGVGLRCLQLNLEFGWLLVLKNHLLMQPQKWAGCQILFCMILWKGFYISNLCFISIKHWKNFAYHNSFAGFGAWI